MSGIVGSYFNTRGSGIVAKLGTDGQVFTSTGAGLKQGFEAAGGGGIFESELLHIRDEKANNTGGGNTTTAFLTRDLNTVKTNEITGASLSSNQITLPAGTYYIEADVPQIQGDSNGVQLYNTTDTAAVIIGTNVYNSSHNWLNNTPSSIRGRFTIAGEKVFEIQHKVGTADSTGKGLGFPSNVSLINIYTEVLIWKVS